MKPTAHIPRWKKWLSYLTEFHIESVSSPQNQHMYVSLRKGRYQLCTANAVYSFEDLYDNFSGAFKRVGKDNLKGSQALLLGLGMASVPYILEQSFEKVYHFTAVEIDEAVVYLAQKYILKTLQAPMEIVIADAKDFMRQNIRQFDLIIMDVFNDDEVPASMESAVFLGFLQKALAPGGLLLYNRLATTKKDVAATKSFFERFKEVFPKALYWDIRGNWILLNRDPRH